MKLDLLLSSLPSLLDLVVTQPLLLVPPILWERDSRFSITVELTNDDDVFDGREFREDLLKFGVDLVSFTSVGVGIGSEEDFRFNLSRDRGGFPESCKE